MHNELLLRDSELCIVNRTSLDGWETLATKFNDLSIVESGRVQYWGVSDNPAFQVGGDAPEGVNWLRDPHKFTPHSISSLPILFAPSPTEQPSARFALALADNVVYEWAA